MAMRQETGFTLIELMITVAVGAILLGVAVPSFFSIIQNNRATAQANDLLSSINIARSEAVKRGATTTVCVSSDQATCTGGTNWAQGWLVWSDTNGNGSLNSPAEIIKAREALTGGTTLTAGVTSIAFNSSGMSLLGATATFTLHSPSCKGTQDRTITLNAVGRANVARTACP